MDRDVDGSPTLVENLNHLLVLFTTGRRLSVINRHSDQSTKLADAMVYVDHVVAHLELLYLLQRQSHLAGACLVRRETVFMVAVENLVVGKDTQPEVVVGETLVQRFLDCMETHAPFLVKDVAQALQLFLTVGQNAELVAVSQILLKRLLQEVEILVKLRLWRDVELNGSVGQT